ncbi:MAG: beta-ketoacyl-[acyl-carrier-protein] synthase family protein [Verrucomicrobiaceae bacterium]|nr:beta-ketoacyl-[acyl-carrier-protein] synthase family protein [Verrucomicrobiaceae bacterium]
MGLVTPLGLNQVDTESSLRAEKQHFLPVTLFDVSHRIAKTAASIELPEQRLFRKVPKHRQHLIDRGTKMLMLALLECLDQAGIQTLSAVDAMVIGTSAGAMPIGEDYFRAAVCSSAKQRGQLARIQAYQPQQQMAMIAAEWDWPGSCCLISNACASGANAIGHALGMIQTGRAKRVLAGGYDALAELVFAGFDSLRALAPSGIPRPFDAARDGLALGEGAAIMLLESEEALLERKRTALARVGGYATATDLHHLTQPDPEGKAAIKTMNGACLHAGLRPDMIDYINSHGTGTPHNDVAEAMAITAWAGDAASRIAVSSTKSSMGHLLGGAGAVEAAICVLAMKGQFLPASLNVREKDAAVRFDLVQKARPASLRHVLTNSFGFGGTNATLALSDLEVNR